MNNLAQVIKVGIADLKIVKNPQKIRTSGLGSCVGVVLFDHRIKIAGMAHVMLPESSMSKQEDKNRSKYADTAIIDLVAGLVKQGGKKSRLQAKIAGGAQMFQFQTANNMMRIGPRNVDAVKKSLKELKIPLIAEDTGGKNGRTIEFNSETLQLNIRTVNKGESVI
ncbi:chemotaxis protein CheD [Halobacillus rhizosphaerae]|uniref:chemotaxis protein CheD n=1 Tax=Halobacillus rhizosphaerae TaxID=3064889 RepID=UPI00398BA749